MNKLRGETIITGQIVKEKRKILYVMGEKLKGEFEHTHTHKLNKKFNFDIQLCKVLLKVLYREKFG